MSVDFCWMDQWNIERQEKQRQKTSFLFALGGTSGIMCHRASLVAQLAIAGDSGSIPGLGRSPGGGNGNLPQYSCLGNPMDRGTWWATVQGVA